MSTEETKTSAADGQSALKRFVMFLAKQKYLCFHKYNVVREYIGVYTQTLTWGEIGDCGKEVYDVYLERCCCCGKRRIKVVGGPNARFHGGIKRLKHRWIKYGET